MSNRLPQNKNRKQEMKHGSLFSGIGGFDLAAEWMGWTNVFHCEWMPFNQRVLNYYWPDAISYSDITKTDFSIHRGSIDILTGGFPCQPFSNAGQRKGTEDERHLWPEMLRAIREIQPRWVVGENVSGLLSWNGGLVFEQVFLDLEAEGYEVQAYVLPACGVNAPHRRDRIWFVAHSTRCDDRGNEREFSAKDGRQEQYDLSALAKSGSGLCSKGFVPNADSLNGRSRAIRRDGAEVGYGGHGSSFDAKCKSNGGSDSGESSGNGMDLARHKLDTPGRNESTNHPITSGIDGTSPHPRGSGFQERNAPGIAAIPGLSTRSYPANWSSWPTQSPLCDGDDGFPTKLDGITFSKWRNESIKAGGNAIVPQVAYQIFQAIEQFESAQ